MKDIENKMNAIAMKYKKNISICMRANNYNEAKLMLYDSASDIQKMFANTPNGELSQEKKEILHINFVLSSLDRNKANLLWKDFFFPIEKFWWMRIYSRSTYYRLRQNAIQDFLYLY